MGRIKKLLRKWGRNHKGAVKQRRLWKRTRRKGHLVRWRQLRRKRRFVRNQIKQEKRRAENPRISTNGVRFIAEFEGFFPTPYNDPAGHATVGYGELLHYGPVTPADRHAVWLRNQKAPGRLTEAEARELLRRRLDGRYEPPVRALFKKGGPLHGKFTQGRYDALVSFAYNLGEGAVRPGSSAGFESIGRAISRADIQAIGDLMLLYDKAGGRALPGLTRRRHAERRLFQTGNYSKS